MILAILFAAWNHLAVLCLDEITPCDLPRSSLVELVSENVANTMNNLVPEPRIVRVIPSDGTQISSRERIAVTWNQPIDHDSFFSRLKISPDLPPENLRILKVTWDDAEAPNTVRIFFEPHFPEDEALTIRIAAGVHGRFGEKISEENFEGTFFVRSPMTILFESLQDIVKNQLRNETE